MKFRINGNERTIQYLRESERHECKLALQLHAVVMEYPLLRGHLRVIISDRIPSIIPGEYDIEISARFDVNGKEYGTGQRISLLELDQRRDHYLMHLLNDMCLRVLTMRSPAVAA